MIARGVVWILPLATCACQVMMDMGPGTDSGTPGFSLLSFSTWLTILRPLIMGAFVFFCFQLFSPIRPDKQGIRVACIAASQAGFAVLWLQVLTRISAVDLGLWAQIGLSVLLWLLAACLKTGGLVVAWWLYSAPVPGRGRLSLTPQFMLAVLLGTMILVVFQNSLVASLKFWHCNRPADLAVIPVVMAFHLAPWFLNGSLIAFMMSPRSRITPAIPRRRPAQT